VRRHTAMRVPVTGLALALAAALWAAPVTAARPGEPAPDFAGHTWLNSGPLTLASERGKAVLVYFWTFGCSNCRAVQPYVRDWYDAYRDAGLQVVAVHAPEFPWERDVDAVARYLSEHDVRYPVVIDNAHAVWRRYNNRYWPALYLVDRRGRVRYRQFGEGRYDETRRWIERVLAEPPGPG
jgi:thiol-disulfide isomerase/thioredoxin